MGILPWPATPCGRPVFKTHLVNNLTKSQLPLKNFPDHLLKNHCSGQSCGKFTESYTLNRAKREGGQTRKVCLTPKGHVKVRFFSQSLLVGFGAGAGRMQSVISGWRAIGLLGARLHVFAEEEKFFSISPVVPNRSRKKGVEYLRPFSVAEQHDRKPGAGRGFAAP